MSTIEHQLRGLGEPYALMAADALAAQAAEIERLREALSKIAAPTHGLRALLDAGADWAEISNFWSEQARSCKRIARAALAETARAGAEGGE